MLAWYDSRQRRLIIERCWLIYDLITLHINEEYDFQNQKLDVKAYSYNLLDKNKNSLIRADSLPHHGVDYRRRKLTHFPHHLHDERGRICSFSGQIEDFVKISAASLGE